MIVVNPNVVCPDPNPLEWEIVDANIEDGAAWNEIVLNPSGTLRMHHRSIPDFLSLVSWTNFVTSDVHGSALSQAGHKP